MLTNRQEQLIDLYVSKYPHLDRLAKAARSGGIQAAKALGDAMSRVAYPDGVSGLDALEISKIGIE